MAAISFTVRNDGVNNKILIETPSGEKILVKFSHGKLHNKKVITVVAKREIKIFGPNILKNYPEYLDGFYNTQQENEKVLV